MARRQGENKCIKSSQSGLETVPGTPRGRRRLRGFSDCRRWPRLPALTFGHDCRCRCARERVESPGPKCHRRENYHHTSPKISCTCEPTAACSLSELSSWRPSFQFRNGLHRFLSLAGYNFLRGAYRRFSLRILILFVRNTPHGPIAVLGYEQRTIVRNRYSHGPAPYIVIINDKPC